MEFLERSADLLAQAERYEVTGEIYKLVIPVYEQERDFNVRWMNSYVFELRPDKDESWYESWHSKNCHIQKKAFYTGKK